MQDVGQEKAHDRVANNDSAAEKELEQQAEAEKAELNGASTDSEGIDSKMDKDQNESEISLEEENVQLHQRIAELEASIEDNKNDFLRSRADLENTRRRMEREKADFIKYGLEKFSKELLPVLDSMDKALETDTDSDAEALREGFKLVQKQLLESLDRHGVQLIKSKGEKFNPDMHQAIARVEDETVTEETVGQVYQEGYQIHDRLLRPAMVQVLIPSESSSN